MGYTLIGRSEAREFNPTSYDYLGKTRADVVNSVGLDMRVGNPIAYMAAKAAGAVFGGGVGFLAATGLCDVFSYAKEATKTNNEFWNDYFNNLKDYAVSSDESLMGRFLTGANAVTSFIAPKTSGLRGFGGQEGVASFAPAGLENVPLQIEKTGAEQVGEMVGTLMTDMSFGNIFSKIAKAKSAATQAEHIGQNLGFVAGMTVRDTLHTFTEEYGMYNGAWESIKSASVSALASGVTGGLFMGAAPMLFNKISAVASNGWQDTAFSNIYNSQLFKGAVESVSTGAQFSGWTYTDHAIRSWFDNSLPALESKDYIAAFGTGFGLNAFARLAPAVSRAMKSGNVKVDGDKVVAAQSATPDFITKPFEPVQPLNYGESILPEITPYLTKGYLKEVAANPQTTIKSYLSKVGKYNIQNERIMYESLESLAGVDKAREMAGVDYAVNMTAYAPKTQANKHAYNIVQRAASEGRPISEIKEEWKTLNSELNNEAFLKMVDDSIKKFAPNTKEYKIDLESSSRIKENLNYAKSLAEQARERESLKMQQLIEQSTQKELADRAKVRPPMSPPKAGIPDPNFVPYREPEREIPMNELLFRARQARLDKKMAEREAYEQLMIDRRVKRQMLNEEPQPITRPSYAEKIDKSAAMTLEEYKKQRALNNQPEMTAEEERLYIGGIKRK